MECQSRPHLKVEILLQAMAGNSGGETITQLEKIILYSSQTMVHGMTLNIISVHSRAQKTSNLLSQALLKEIGTTELISYQGELALILFHLD